MQTTFAIRFPSRNPPEYPINSLINCSGSVKYFDAPFQFTTLHGPPAKKSELKLVDSFLVVVELQSVLRKSMNFCIGGLELWCTASVALSSEPDDIPGRCSRPDSVPVPIKETQEEEELIIPDELSDHLSGELLLDAVTLPSGKSVSASALHRFWQSRLTSGEPEPYKDPFTMLTIDPCSVTENHELRRLCHELREKQRAFRRNVPLHLQSGICSRPIISSKFNIDIPDSSSSDE